MLVIAHAGETLPIREVAAFEVAPVADRLLTASSTADGLGASAFKVHAKQASYSTSREAETRVLFGESWPDLIRRASQTLAAGWIDPKIYKSPPHELPALVPGKYISMRSDPGRRVLDLDYVLQTGEAYSVRVDADSIEVRPRRNDAALLANMRADVSKASLFTATDAIGLPDDLVLQLVDIFADEIDFHRELHDGYRCTLVYEAVYAEGHIEPAGRILAAEIRLADRTVDAYYFDDGNGRTGYFSAAGKSLKKVFRQSPVQFSRVTSGYTLARFHPVLGVWRAHRGTDYAAPAGTPVMATADGVVIHAGAQGSFGNLVVLNHEGGYATYYAHLQDFAGKLTAGMAVRKGDILGYVGMTGLATGPHLHYEFRVAGIDGDWKSVPPPETPESIRISSEAYFAAVEAYRAQLRFAQQTQLVTLE